MTHTQGRTTGYVSLTTPQPRFVTVTLSDDELFHQAAVLATMRHLAAYQRGLKDPRPGARCPLEAHFWGRAGEIAYAKAAGVYPDATINTFRATDIGHTQVRTRIGHHEDLIVRPHDADNEPFALVTVEPFQSTHTFRVYGHILAKDAKQDEWAKDPGGFGKAYFVPQAALSAPPRKT